MTQKVEVPSYFPRKGYLPVNSIMLISVVYKIPNYIASNYSERDEQELSGQDK